MRSAVLVTCWLALASSALAAEQVRLRYQIPITNAGYEGYRLIVASRPQVVRQFPLEKRWYVELVATPAPVTPEERAQGIRAVTVPSSPGCTMYWGALRVDEWVGDWSPYSSHVWHGECLDPPPTIPVPEPAAGSGLVAGALSLVGLARWRARRTACPKPKPTSR